MATYNSFYEFITDDSLKQPKIERIDASIEALLDSLARNLLDGELAEYHFNDGQTVVKTVYRDPSKMIEALRLLRIERNAIINYGNRIIGSRGKNSFRLKGR